MSAKAQRQQLIADWIREGPVSSQDDLVARLARAGIVASQGTVSRDLDELGAVRVRRDGGLRYVIASDIDPGQAADKLDRLLGEYVTAILPAGALVVLRTPPGSAGLVANALDAADLPDVAGSIAGDDTIFLAVSDGRDAAMVAQALCARRLGR